MHDNPRRIGLVVFGLPEAFLDLLPANSNECASDFFFDEMMGISTPCRPSPMSPTGIGGVHSMLVYVPTCILHEVR